MPFVLTGPTQLPSVSQYTSDITVVPCCTNSNISTPFLSRKTDAITFVADNIYLNFSGLFGERMLIHCRDWSLVSTFTNKT
jgi:hypothetical protein